MNIEHRILNKDELKGKADQAKGRVKEAAGDLTDDEWLKNAGEADETAGRIEEGFGKARRKTGEALEDIADRIMK